VQSTALLVLAVQGRIDFPLFLFANVGDNAENPATLAYITEHAVPYALAHGIELVELRWVDRTGRTRDLYDDLLRQENSLTIPLRDTGGFGPRKCTGRYKIDVVARELRDRGAQPDDPAVIAMGISTDEYQRARVGVDRQHPWTTRVNPLLDLGLSRTDCRRVIAEAGLPVPAKSSCWFCPFQGPEQWRSRRRNEPGLWGRAVELDRVMSERHTRLRTGPAGLASPTLPLDQAVDDQLVLDGMDGCDSGWCMT
jgi:hypothetical protein